MYLWLSLPTDCSQGLCICSAVQSIPCKMPGSYYSLDSLPELICVCSGDSLIPVQSHSDRQGRLAASFVRPHAKWKCKVPHLNIFKNVNMGTSTGPFWTWGPVGRQGSQAVKLALPKGYSLFTIHSCRQEWIEGLECCYGQWQTFFSWASESLQMVTAVMKLKDACSLKEKLWPT